MWVAPQPTTGSCQVSRACSVCPAVPAPRLPFPSLPNQLYHRSSLVHFSLDQGLNLPLFFSSLLLFGTVPSFPSSSLSSLHLVYPFCSLSFLLYKGFCSSFSTFLPTITSMPRPLLPSISEHP